MDDSEVKSEEGAASQPREGSNSDTPKPKRPSQVSEDSEKRSQNSIEGEKKDGGQEPAAAKPKKSILLQKDKNDSKEEIKEKISGDSMFDEGVSTTATATATATATDTKLNVDNTKSKISKQLMILLDEDSKEFTELDIKEMMPSSPFSDTSFSRLKEFFDNIVQDLNSAQKVGIPLDEIREEFNFIWDGIQKSHDNLNSLLNKDVELTVEVADTMAKTRNLIRIAEDHPEITARLGSRLETAWNLVDVSEEEERRNANRIEELKTDIMILNRNIQAAANMEGQTELNELFKIRRKLQDERDVLLKDMGRMRTSLALLQERKSRLGEKKVEYQESIRYSDEESSAQSEALRRELERKENIEKDIENLTASIESKTKELEDTEKSSQQAKHKLLEFERGVSSQRVMNDAAMKDAENALAKLDKLKADYNAQQDLVEKLVVETFKKQNDLKEKENEIIRIKAEGMQAVRLRNTNLKRCAVLQQRLDSLEADREVLKQKIIDLELELEAAQKKLEENRKRVEELDKKRTVVNRNLTRAKTLASEHDNQLKVHLVATNNLEREMEGYKKEIVAQTDMILRLERERDYYSNEATKLAHEFAARLEEVKKMDTIVFEFQKKIGELEGSIKTKQQEFEQSLVEKRFFEKLLRDTGTAIVDSQKGLRHKTFELNMSIYSYYDEQNKYAGQKALLDSLLREGTFFKQEADRIRKMAVDMRREVEALECERSLLGCGVAEAENELAKQRYYVIQAESRRENYNRRLQQRESELKEIWSNWRTLHSMVRIGAYHFRHLMAEIREVRQSICNLRRLQHKFKGNVSHIVQLQQEISVLENCIAKETCMVNALEFELDRPINVHRWRALEAIDPDAYDMIKKINIVTKRLVDQNESIRKQSGRISDKERIYVDLKHVLRRLPSIETPEMRQYYEVLLNAKKDQLKKIKMELYAMESQKIYFRNEVSKINDRMKDLKAEYFAKMRKGESLKRKESILPPIESTPTKSRISLSKGQSQTGESVNTSTTGQSHSHADAYSHQHIDHPFQEYEEGLQRGGEKQSTGGGDQANSQSHQDHLHEDFDLKTMKEVFRRYSQEQDEIQKDIEKRKSQLSMKRKSSHVASVKSSHLLSLIPPSKRSSVVRFDEED